MTSNRKRPQSKVDRALSSLSPEDKEEWEKLLDCNANYSQLARWLKEKGHDVSGQNLSVWYISNRPRGEDAIIVNQLTAKYDGVKPEQALQLSIGITTQLITAIYNELETGKLQVTDFQRLTAIASLIRELNLSSRNMQKLEFDKDTENLVKLGSLEMAEVLREIFKESAFIDALEEGIESAQLKIAGK
jgi:hypothetical protein